MILVGGVSQQSQGDLDVGRVVAERLKAELAGDPDVRVEDLSFGAVAASQLLEELRPEALVLVGAVERAAGRVPGTVEVKTVDRWDAVAADADLGAQGAVADAVAGYVGIDLLVEVAAGLGALPPTTVVVEVEPAATASGQHLSPEVEAALPQAVDAVRGAVAAIAGGRGWATEARSA